MKTILVVEDEPSIAQIAADYLRHGGFGVITASNGVDALAQARAQRPDLIVLDLGSRASMGSRLREHFAGKVMCPSSCSRPGSMRPIGSPASSSVRTTM
jgi:DNA-binding response OmpR family regulator